MIETAISKFVKKLAPTARKLILSKLMWTKIRFVIGKMEKTIDKIIAETGVKIDIDERRKRVYLL